MAQRSRGGTQASVEGLGHLAVPRFVDDTVNRFSIAVGTGVTVNWTVLDRKKDTNKELTYNVHTYMTRTTSTRTIERQQGTLVYTKPACIHTHIKYRGG